MAADGSMDGYVPLVRVVRGSRTESVHHGAIVVCDASGRVVHSAGDARAVTFLRSSAKPFQILPVLASGAAARYGLSPAEVAVAIASHSGQDFHVRAVRSILDRIGLRETSLMCGVHEPLHEPTARRMREAGEAPGPVHCNCSGKHAAMLALALHRGAAPAGYELPEHPVQVEMLATVSGMTGVPRGGIGLAVDNCTVPTFALPLAAAATGYARLMEPDGLDRTMGDAARRAVEAMRAHPEMVGGEDVIDTDLIRAAGVDLVAKRGAEAFYGIGYRMNGRGFGVAVKIADGSMGRGRNVVVLSVVRRLGLVPPDRLDTLDERHLLPVRDNRGREVGRVEAAFELD